MSTQRAYRAACPNCGAPVEFASAASASAVCSYCRSTLLREGEALRRIGESAEVFDDHSPLQPGVRGSHQGEGFSLVGRLQYGYEGGTWNEWHALFDSGRSGWLSEDNGAYVLAFDAPLAAPPAVADLRAGAALTLDGQPWQVASVTTARLLAAQGELPRPPTAQGEFTLADLRNGRDEVATLDYSGAGLTPPQAPQWSRGRSVALASLGLSGLREDIDKTLQGRSLACPSCGAALAPTLASTQSIACGQCSAVVDISQGAGADLAHYAQANGPAEGAQPAIPLGRIGRLGLDGAGGPSGEPLDWQVVGFMERCDIPTDPEEDASFWREYLLYNRLAGFAFLVDAEDGWSFVRPLTGAPELGGNQARWQGQAYRKRYTYAAKVTWVQGEFYWRVKREQRALVMDFDGQDAAAGQLLSREQSGAEVTWSAGRKLGADAVEAAFGLAAGRAASAGSGSGAFTRDVTPLASADAGSLLKWVVILVFVLLFVAMLTRCGRDDCDELRSSFGAASNEYQQCLRSQRSGSGARVGGGSFGGYSSGGGHK